MAELNGIVLVDKPAGMTSHDVVDRLRKAAGMRKIGHTGTLDPAATGLLILCLGNATRLSETLTGLPKTYEGYLRFGVATDSHDMDGKVLETHEVPEIRAEEIQSAFDEFTGDIQQMPPMVSAVKIGGERLYKKARKGEVVERPARDVTVHEFVLLDWSAPLARFRVSCSSGTYVRSLCHDVGSRFGCGGVLDSLRRTAVGTHQVANATPLEQFQTREDVERAMVPLNQALDLPEVIVIRAAERLVASGSPLRRTELESQCPINHGWVQVKSKRGELLALAEVHAGPYDIELRPKRVFMGGK
jgi:tRNA pseudouridine55 synthase